MKDNLHNGMHIKKLYFIVTGVNLIYNRLQTSKRISGNFCVQLSNLFYHLDSSAQVFNDLEKSHSADKQNICCCSRILSVNVNKFTY